jgi:HNH endonuclease
MRRRKFTLLEKTFVQQRAHHCCEYCKFPMVYSHDSFHIEHIIPLILGGTNELINLALACDGCNSFKWGFIVGFDKITNTMVSLFNPREDDWKAHFMWSEDFSLIIGNSATGRATVDLLQLNRQGLINIRRALLAFGVKALES